MSKHPWWAGSLVVCLCSSLVLAGGCGDDAGDTTASSGPSITVDGADDDEGSVDTGKGQPEESQSQERSVYGVDLSGLELPDAEPYDDYELLEDDTGQLEVEAPTSWSDVDTSVARRDQREVPGIWASTDLEALGSGYSVAGLQVDLRTVSSAGTALEMLRTDNVTADTCAERDSFDYDDGRYRGTAELWTDCSDSGAALLQFAVLRAGNQYITGEIQMLDDADVDAAIRALETFNAVEVKAGEQWQEGDDATTQSVGDQFVLAVTANYSVGDHWRVVDSYDDGIVRFLWKDYESDSPGAAGGGGTDFFTFEAVAPGTTTVTLENCFRCDSDGDGEVEPGAGEITEFTEVQVTVE